MKFSFNVVVFFFSLFLALPASGRNYAGSRKWIRMEKNIQQLMRSVKKMDQQRQDDRIKMNSSPEEMQLVKATMAALESESRALSQFDLQFRNLQESLYRTTQHKDQQAEAYRLFRQELINLRSEMEVLKERNTDAVSTENAAKTLQWLTQSVEQLRNDINEMNEMNAKWNLSGIYQQSQHVQKQIHLVQSEVRGLRQQATEEKATEGRITAELVQLRNDFDQLAADHQSILQQLNALSSDVVPESGDSSHRLADLTSTLESLLREQKRKMHHLQTKSTSIKSNHKFKKIQNRIDELDVFYATLQLQLKGLNDLSANVSRVNDAVKRLEGRYDAVDAAMTSVEAIAFNVTQVHVLVQQVQQKQEKREDQLDEMSVDLVSMADQLERNGIAVLTLLNGAANETLHRCRDDNRRHIIDLKIRTIQEQLAALQFHMDGPLEIVPLE